MYSDKALGKIEIMLEKIEIMLEKIEIMLDRIKKIYKICEQYGGVKNALQDELLAQPAIMKNFDIMYEQIEKLGKDTITKEFVNAISEAHRIGLQGTRNVSSHSYNDLNFILVGETILNDLPNLKNELENLHKKIISELQNEPSADTPDDDTPPPPSQGQGTRHKR